jgi:hypothetical protein
MPLPKVPVLKCFIHPCLMMMLTVCFALLWLRSERLSCSAIGFESEGKYALAMLAQRGGSGSQFHIRVFDRRSGSAIRRRCSHLRFVIEQVLVHFDVFSAHLKLHLDCFGSMFLCFCGRSIKAKS